MVELLAPAGSPTSVEAAVQAGAGAIYLGYGDFNARRNAKNFTLEQLEQAVDYCHLRGVSVFLTLNTLLNQRELEQGEALLQEVGQIGIDAVIVQDLGVADLVKQVAPSMALHGSTQMTIHSLDGVKQLQDFGFSRVVLSRELGKSELEYISARSPLELEVFVHGAQCMSYSGQCYLSALVGQRSGNRGLCAQPCRLEYHWKDNPSTEHCGKKGKKQKGSSVTHHPMSLKDMSLVHHLSQLSDMGIHSFKIEGRMKRGEYVYIVTQIYANLLKERREPTQEELQALEMAFSRQGFTSGYYQESVGSGMFGIREESPEPKELFAKARQGYEKKETAKITVFCDVNLGENLTLAFRDQEGNQVERVVDWVEPVKNKELTIEALVSQLQRTGGTPFSVEEGNCVIETGCTVPFSKLNQLRRELLEELGQKRIDSRKQSQFGHFTPLKKEKTESVPPVFTVWVQEESQITTELLDLQPELLYLPYTSSPETIKQAQSKSIPLCLQVPNIASDREREELGAILQKQKELGVNQVLVGTMDSAYWAKSLGFDLRGDFGLGFMNNHSLEQWRGILQSATPSFELKFPQIRDLRKEIPLEILVYGHLPLMTTKNCMISNESSTKSCQKKCEDKVFLIDRKGEEFPVEAAYGGRNILFNGKPLYLADKYQDWSALGLWAARLCFTRETPKECVKILREYQQQHGTPPEEFTRGLYYRGVL